MAKKYRPKVKGYDAGQAVTTKSPYGSHADMVVELEELQSIPFFTGIETSLLDDGVVTKMLVTLGWAATAGLVLYGIYGLFCLCRVASLMGS